MSKKITVTELLKLIPQNNESQKYLCWEKLNPTDFNNFNLVGNLDTNSDNQSEFSTKENYWSKNYPIALDYFPNSGCEIYADNIGYYLVYRDFGGHKPERRCRLIRRELIIEGSPTDKLALFLAKKLSKKLDDVAEAWKAYYPQIFFERKLFEDIMGHFRYKKANGWKHTGDISKNFEAIDFYKVISSARASIFCSCPRGARKRKKEYNEYKWFGFVCSTSETLAPTADNLFSNLSKGEKIKGCKVYSKADCRFMLIN